ncbi:hypothetical protein BDF14DRAFT_1882258 [Spinellus fusiger]|nr:hypothetical protein BDF14DRAFT_1882258 [Spinellus fusiger]
MWRENPPDTHRLIIIEEKSHFNHVFGFPRASVKTGFERDLFVPYNNFFGGDESIGKVIQAKATKIHAHSVEIDRDIPGFGQSIEFDYMIYSTGATIPAPGHLSCTSKEEGISALKQYQQMIKDSQKPIIGGGAVGIELASEIKEQYPEKEVTLLHSRDRYLPRYKISLHEITFSLLREVGVCQIMGERVILPPEGFPLEVNPIEVFTSSGKIIKGDLAIMCIGMIPNSGILARISRKSIHHTTGFVNVKPTLQIQDSDYPHIFAAGDVIEHSDVKTGHFAWMQGIAVLNNIKLLIKGADYDSLPHYISKDVALIKLVLGDKRASMQTNAFGPLITVGSWIAGRSIPHNVYASSSWSWANIPLDDHSADL